MPQSSTSSATPLNPNQSEQASSASYTTCTKSECLIHPNSSSGEGVSNVSRDSPNYEAFRGIAVDVFKSRNLAAIGSLKKFLTALPSPSYIRRVLLQAIYQLADQELEICRWLIQHRHHLEPELKLLEVAQQIVTEQLQNQGLILNQDFSFTADGKLEVSEVIKTAALEGISVGDRLLIEEILLIR